MRKVQAGRDDRTEGTDHDGPWRVVRRGRGSSASPPPSPASIMEIGKHTQIVGQFDHTKRTEGPHTRSKAIATGKGVEKGEQVESCSKPGV